MACNNFHMYLQIYGPSQQEETNFNCPIGVPFLAQQLTNPNRMHEDAGSIPGLAQWVKDLVLL